MWAEADGGLMAHTLPGRHCAVAAIALALLSTATAWPSASATGTSKLYAPSRALRSLS